MSWARTEVQEGVQLCTRFYGIARRPLHLRFNASHTNPGPNSLFAIATRSEAIKRGLPWASEGTGLPHRPQAIQGIPVNQYGASGQGQLRRVKARGGCFVVSSQGESVLN